MLSSRAGPATSKDRRARRRRLDLLTGPSQELDLVGDDLVAGTTLADVGLPLVELEAPGDCDLAALLEVADNALGEAAEGHDVDEDRSAVLALARPPTVDGEAQSAT